MAYAKRIEILHTPKPPVCAPCTQSKAKAQPVHVKVATPELYRTWHGLVFKITSIIRFIAEKERLLHLPWSSMLDATENRQQGKRILHALVIPTTRAAEPKVKQEVLQIIGNETVGRFLGVST